MSLCRFLLVAFTALLANVDALAAASHNTESIPRLLRVVSDTEERTGLSTKIADFFSKFTSKEYQVVRWAEADKTDDFVKKALKIKGSKGAHKNYKYFEQFKELKQSLRASALVDEGATTSQVWTKLGLGDVHTIDDILKVEPTERFRLYSVYLDHVDNRIELQLLKHKTPIPVLSDDLTWAEKTVRASVWVATNRSKSFVRASLGLEGLTPAQIAKHKNIEFYLTFLEGHLKKNLRSIETADF